LAIHPSQTKSQQQNTTSVVAYATSMRVIDFLDRA
jgi:hypothetical protein